MRRMAMGVVRMRQMATEDCERQQWAGAGAFLWDRGQKGAILPETKDKLRNIGSPHFLSQDPSLIREASWISIQTPGEQF